MLRLLVVLVLAGGGVVNAKAGVNISLALSTSTNFGLFKSFDGSLLTTGGVSVGFFQDNSGQIISPDWTQLKNVSAAQAWGALRGNGYKDLRTLTGVSQPSDWDFSTNTVSNTNSYTSFVGGTITGISLTELPASTRLYVVGFNSGSWDSNSNLMETASFGGTEWGVVSRGENFLSPHTNLMSFAIVFKARGITTDDILVGTASPEFSTVPNVHLAPEPSSLSLLIAGGAVLMAERRRNRS